MSKYIEDIKNYDGLNQYNRTIERMMKRYELKKGSYEYSIWAKKLFAEMQWESVTKDIITPFWKVFTAALVWLSSQNEYYRGKWRNKTVRPTYIFVNNSIYYRTEYNKIDDENGFPLSKATLGTKYNEGTTVHSKYVDAVMLEFNELIELAEITDSMANFAPCPEKPFNSLKGLLPEVSDFLNLMIDKLQICLDEGVGLEYMDYGGNVYCACVEEIKMWHNWFRVNQEKYYLQDYYDIEDEKLVGRPLFSTQSLLNPIPQTAEEIHECAGNISRIIHNREIRMSSTRRLLENP